MMKPRRMIMAQLKKQIRRRLPLVFIFLILLAGIGLFMYPIVSNWYGEYTAHTSIESYDKTIQKVGDQAIMKMQRDADEYNKALSANDNKKVSSMDYDELLAVTDSIAYIEIPKINVYLPIFHGMDDEVLQKGVGHMEGTSLPVGGSSTHCVLAGHTGLPSANLFTDLDQLDKGDYFYIHALDKVLAYQVDQVKTVLPYETDDIQIREAEDYVTLVTCTPYGINSHRLLVRGVRVPYKTQDMAHTDPWPVVHKDEPQQIPFRTIVWYASLGVISVVTVVILLILFVPGFHKKKRKQTDDEKKT